MRLIVDANEIYAETGQYPCIDGVRRAQDGRPWASDLWWLAGPLMPDATVSVIARAARRAVLAAAWAMLTVPGGQPHVEALIGAENLLATTEAARTALAVAGRAEPPATAWAADAVEAALTAVEAALIAAEAATKGVAAEAAIWEAAEDTAKDATRAARAAARAVELSLRGLTVDVQLAAEEAEAAEKQQQIDDLLAVLTPELRRLGWIEEGVER